NGQRGLCRAKSRIPLHLFVRQNLSAQNKGQRSLAMNRDSQIRMTNDEIRRKAQTRVTNRATARQSAVGDMGFAVLKRTPFPLTLTLSHREREQPAPRRIVRDVRWADTALGFAESQRRILPLPRGEGGGEGNRDACGTEPNG